MPIRSANPADIRALAELWTLSFPGERTVADRMRQIELGIPFGGLDDIFVEEEDGRILGAYRAYRLTQVLDGEALPMSGLAAVAVDPSARRRGVGVRLCRHALVTGRERGDVLSTLYPFRPRFYSALGWGTVGEIRRYLVRPRDLPDDPARRHLRPALRGDHEAIARIYSAAIARANGPIHRSPAVWSHHLERPGSRFWILPGGTGEDPGGYMILRFGGGRSPERRTLHVPELVAAGERSYRGLIGWLAAQGDQWPRIRIDATPGDWLAHRLADPRPPGYRQSRVLWYEAERVLRGPMLRILDVKRALRARRLRGGGGGVRFLVGVEDEELPANRGPWRVEADGDGTTVVAAEGAPRPGDGEGETRLTTDAAGIARIIAGDLRPSVAARIGQAEIKGNAETLDRFFQTREPFRLLDEF